MLDAAQRYIVLSYFAPVQVFSRIKVPVRATAGIHEPVVSVDGVICHLFAEIKSQMLFRGCHDCERQLL